MKAITDLHDAWCSASGQELNRAATERIFYSASQLGFVPYDVTLVVDHMIRFNKKSGGAKFRINAFKVMGDLELFASMLAEVKAMKKNSRPPQTPKQQVEQLRERVIDKEESSTMRLTPGCHISDVLKTLGNQ